MRKPGGLFLRRWPDQVADGPAVQIAELDGEIVAGDVMLDPKDVMHLALLVLVGAPEGLRSLKLMQWSVPKDAASARPGPTLDVEWPSDVAIDHAVLQIGPLGTPVAILHGGERWSIFEPKRGLRDLPAKVTMAQTAIDLSFLMLGKPYLVVGRPLIGFEVLDEQGEPLPHSCG